MKIRNGFVSNSSSSSFCIIAVKDNYSINELGNAEGFKIFSRELQDNVVISHGVLEGKVLKFFGSYSHVFYVGIDAEELLRTMSIPEACNKFSELVKKEFDIDLPENSINFYFGECGE